MSEATCGTVDGEKRAARIRELNDQFRKSFVGGQVVFTSGVQALGVARVAALLQRVRAFNEFSADNDPYKEHDFGAFDEGGQRFFWKIDPYDRTLRYGSEDPADPSKTCRVLTLMLAHEH